MTKTELAILGGAPAFSDPVHVGRPNIGNRDAFMKRVGEILDRRWLSNSGPVVIEFEEKLSEFLNVPEVVAVCNATVGLELAARALGMTGEVIVPSFTFIATAHALQWQQISPVFCDIRAVDHNLDPEAIERVLTPDTSGILAVHCWGRPAEVKALEEIADKHGLKLLYDSSHALGCTYKGSWIGGFGGAEVFSFHATKFINALEGGCITTRNGELAQELRYMQNFGFRGYDDVGYIGINGKMNEVSAAMGLTNLESIDRLLAVNKSNFEAYQTVFSDIPGVRFLPGPEGESFNYQYVVLEIDELECPLSRDEIMDVYWAENVHARRYFYPGCHRMEPYRSIISPENHHLPQTESISSRVLVLPTGETVGRVEINEIARIFMQALDSSIEVRSALLARDANE